MLSAYMLSVCWPTTKVRSTTTLGRSTESVDLNSGLVELNSGLAALNTGLLSTQTFKLSPPNFGRRSSVFELVSTYRRGATIVRVAFNIEVSSNCYAEITCASFANVAPRAGNLEGRTSSYGWELLNRE